jgi:hypothetical protein
MKIKMVKMKKQIKMVKITKTKKYQKNIPNSYGLKYNCIHDIYTKPVEIFNCSDPEVVCKIFIERLE